MHYMQQQEARARAGAQDIEPSLECLVSGGYSKTLMTPGCAHVCVHACMSSKCSSLHTLASELCLHTIYYDTLTCCEYIHAHTFGPLADLNSTACAISDVIVLSR